MSVIQVSSSVSIFSFFIFNFFILYLNFSDFFQRSAFKTDCILDL